MIWLVAGRSVIILIKEGPGISCLTSPSKTVPDFGRA